MKKQAVVIISGKVLERPFPLYALDVLRESVEAELAQRGLIATRCVAPIGAARYLAAAFFLASGFEVVPADDDEDAQAAFMMQESAFSEQPPDEIVFALGTGAEPSNLARVFRGRAALTSLYFPGSADEDGSSQPFLLPVDNFLDARELFKKHGWDWRAYESKTWSEWSASLFGASSSLLTASAKPAKIKRIESKSVEAEPAPEPGVAHDGEEERDPNQKMRKRAWGELEYHVEGIAEGEPENELDHWERVVSVLTELCDVLGEKPSSDRFRKLFQNLVGKTPKEVETTDAFRRIMQEAGAVPNKT